MPGKKKPASRKSQKKLWMVYIIFSLIILLGIGIYIVTNVKTSSGLSIWEMYQNMANPYVRYVHITEGMRKEEVADRFAQTLGWTPSEKAKLIKTYTLAMNGKSEGYYLPDTYLVPVQANASVVSKTIEDNFDKVILQKETGTSTSVINMDTAIKIASIIQRESGGKSDMRIISGVIWNRIFQGMPLGMDATLQYAKGTEGAWWPVVKPADKNIDSPFNTYKNIGLPPSAISNPGKDAIDAALHPAITKAIFYIHDTHGRIHTATTYAGHLANIKEYY